MSLETPYNANNTTVGGVVSFQGPASPGALWVYGRADFSPASGPVTLILPYLAIESLGTLTGTDNFAVTGEFDWLAGTLSGSAGSSLVANGGLVFNPGGTHADILDGRSLTNNGAAVVTGNNSGIDLAHGAAFNNGSPTNPQATFSIQVTGGGAAIYPDDVDSGGVFNNYGTFLSSTLTLRMAVPFNNSGTVEVQSGSIDLGAGGQSSGSFTGDLGTGLSFGGAHVFGPTTSVGGDSIDFETNVSLETPYNANNTTVGGVVSFQGPASPGALWVYGRADFSPASGPVTLILPYLAIESLGTLTGTDNFAVTGEFDWLAGTLSGSAGSSLVANGGLVFNPGGTHADILDGRSLTNNGAAVVTGNNSGIDLAHGAAFNNGSPTNPQATFSIQVTGGGAAIYPDDVDSGGVFNNYGTFLSSTLTLRMAVPFNNSGTVEVQSGSIDLGAGGQSSGSFTGDLGTGLSFGGSVVLTPSSTVTGDSIGFGGVLYLQIAGLQAGSGFDQITVGGSVALGGSLNPELIDGFTPSLGEQFTIINNTSTNAISGQFNGLSEGAIFTSGANQFQISYSGGDGNDVVLSTVAVAKAGGPYTMPYGGTLMLDASGSADIYGDSLTYSWTINGHANAAIGVQPVLNWSQLQALGITSSGSFVVSVQVSNGRASAMNSAPAMVSVTLAPSSLSGTVFTDFNDDGQIDFGETGIAGVAIALTGTDDLGHMVSLCQTTDGDGAYVFLNLRPGNYQITETQPAGYPQGIDTVGTAGGSLVATDQFFVQLAQGVDGLNYNFGEQPPTTGAVKKGQAAGIGFWNNKNGQALILALNGGTGHQLGDWLAATMPNTFGASAGSNNLTGKSNAFVAALFQQDFLMKGVKLDAQVLATALSVYVTDSTLDSTGIATHYGFTVSGAGLGTDTVNVGSSGDAFGVANNTVMTVLDLLVAADAQAVNGVLYNGNVIKRNEANSLFSALNEAGGIS